MSAEDRNAAPVSSENTPLLDDQDHEPRGLETSDPGPSHQSSGDDNDDAATSDILTPRSRTFFIAVLYAALLLSICITGLVIAAFFMLQYGYSRFGAYDYELNGGYIFWIIAIGLVGAIHAVYNILRLSVHKFSKLPSKRLLPVTCASLSVAFVLFLAPYYLDLDNWYCSRDRLGGPHPWYPGTWEQCKRWEFSYKAVTFSLIMALGLNAILLFTFILTASRIARSRSPAPNPNWNISPGYFSFELSFRWGGADPSEQPQRYNVTDMGGNGQAQSSEEQA